MLSPGGSNTRQFAAWVPTITGQLSFSLLGEGVDDALAANGAATPSIGDANAPRHVVVIQSRRTKDRPWPLWLQRAAKAEYVLIGKTRDATRPVIDTDVHGTVTLQTEPDHVGVLEGRILVIPFHADKKAGQAARRAIRGIRKLVTRAVEANQLGDTRALAKLGDTIQELIARAAHQDVSAVGANFSLYRTGEFRLAIDEELPEVEDESAPAAPADEAFRLMIARQMYYFVKDVGHRHYHHDQSRDNLLPLTLADGDDESWRRETLWSLARAVVSLRRGNRLAAHKHALGILAYADAFQSHLARVRRRAGEDAFELADTGPTYDFGHTRLSLEATIDEQSFLKSFWSQFQAMLIATGLAAMAIWIAAVDIREAACGNLDAAVCQPPVPPPLLQAALRFVIEDPQWPFFALVVAGLTYFEVARRSLSNIRYVELYLQGVSGWVLALGATVSRVYARLDPYGADTFGRAVMLLAFVFLSYEVIITVGAIFTLVPPYSVTSWLATLLYRWVAGLAGPA